MTSTAGWTPGPWYTMDREDMLRIREEASDYIIATTDDGGHPELEVFDFAQQQANARLIAASPALYEALAAITAYPGIREYVGNLIYDRARAALSLANGEKGK